MTTLSKIICEMNTIEKFIEMNLFRDLNFDTSKVHTDAIRNWTWNSNHVLKKKSQKIEVFHASQIFKIS